MPHETQHKFFKLVKSHEEEINLRSTPYVTGHTFSPADSGF